MPDPAARRVLMPDGTVRREVTPDPPARRVLVSAPRPSRVLPPDTAALPRPPAVLADVEGRLRSMLDPYRDRLDLATIYGIEVLRRPDAKAHHWFAGVQPITGAVKLNFLPMHAHPELADGISPALRKRRTGASVFRFTVVDEGLFAELQILLARGFEVYIADSRS